MADLNLKTEKLRHVLRLQTNPEVGSKVTHSSRSLKYFVTTLVLPVHIGMSKTYSEGIHIHLNSEIIAGRPLTAHLKETKFEIFGKASVER